ncbi:hypothetical protein BGZ81_007912 [Podila clonocystis]|nr:hypothetical protein BGZ81_007912 [Podila clonocystis]
MVSPHSLYKLQADDLMLYKAPKGAGFFTEPGVTVGAKDEITAASSLRGMFEETNTVQVIIRPPSFKRNPINAVQYDGRSGDLVWKQDAFKKFPVHGICNFKELRECADFCLFDKTAFIMAIESFRECALIFLRPRRSGKSLALSTLAHFHGREHLPDYKPLFEGLAIDEHVKKGEVNPGRYFVLPLDFAAVSRSPDRKKAEDNLNIMLNESIMRFYRTYEPFLRMSADYLIEKCIQDNAAASLMECVDVVHNILRCVDSPEDPLSKIKGIYVMADEYDSFSNDYLVPVDSVHWKPPQEAEPDSLLKGFFACVKSGLGRSISKCYMTGVSPQCLVDNRSGSGFNVAHYVSWEPELARFCGLTEADVAAALALEKVCGSTTKAKKHLKIMRDHYNSFNFVPRGRGPLTYNTSACLEYLQADELARSREAWLSYMVYLGGLTFCVNKKALRIPNLVAAERFGSAILHRHHASLEDVTDALRLLTEDGNIDTIIGLYARGMQQHDVGAHGFKKKEEYHCKSMRFALLCNIHPSLRKVGVETTITKSLGMPGGIYMLVSVRSLRRLFVLEWKSIHIDYIKIGSGSQLRKANALANISDANKVLDLKFSNDKPRAGQTMKQWILNEPKDGEGHSPQQQLRDYVQDREIKKWEKDGYTITPVLVVVVGSRHILLWNLAGDKLDDSPRLALA